MESIEARSNILTNDKNPIHAEGVQVGVGAHGQPIYRNPVFQAGDQLKHPRTGTPIDYSRVYCPEAERIYATEALRLGHAVFLGGREDMDLILDAIRKVRENTDELRSLM